MQPHAPIPDTPAEVTRDWLATVLGDKRGDVAHCEVIEQRETPASHCGRIALTYGDRRTETMFIKLTKTARRCTFVPWAGRLQAMNQNEIDFYEAAARDDSPTVPFDRQNGAHRGHPVLRCHARAIDDDGRALLLLDDATPTHTRATAAIEPCFTALARLHAAWWENPLLGRAVGRRLQPRRVEQARPNCRDLPPRRRARAARLLACLDDVFAPHGPRTLLHGDTNPANFLFPRDAASHEPLLADWQTNRIGSPSDDLAMVLVPRVPPGESAEREPALLRVWLEEIDRRGVSCAGRAFTDAYDRAVLRFLALALFEWDVADEIIERAFLAADRRDAWKWLS
jgi:hypothetical protein